MKKGNLRAEANEEITSKVKLLMNEDEVIKVAITGTDMKNIYTRLATTPVTVFVPFGLATNPMITGSQEYNRFYFTDKGVIIVGLDYFQRYINSVKFSYDEIEEVIYHEKNKTLEIKTLDKQYVLEVSDYARENLMDKIKEQVEIKNIYDKYNGKSKRVFNKVLVAEYAVAAIGLIYVTTKLI